MRVHVILPPRLAEEGHSDHASHVEPSYAGSQNRCSTNDPAAFEGGMDDFVLRPESRERRNTHNR